MFIGFADKNDAIWFVIGDNPLCIMFYDGFLIYASTQGNPLQVHQKKLTESPHRYSGAKGGRDFED